MAKKTETLNLRVTPDLKMALKAAADMERRTLANMVEKLIVDHCESIGIQPGEQQLPMEFPSQQG